MFHAFSSKVLTYKHKIFCIKYIYMQLELIDFVIVL